MPTRRLMLALALVSIALSTVVLPLASAQRAVPGPVNAATRYGWGRPQRQDDFVGARKNIWKVRGHGNVRTQHGMLTLNTRRHGSVSATLSKAGHRTGRWEIRLRSRRYGTSRHDFRVRTELVPSGGRAAHCGARNIVLNDYLLGTGRADLHVRALPARSYDARTTLNLGADRWHTFAIEVTPKRVSWFVDAHVATTERRSGALSGVPLTVRFTMADHGGSTMNPSRMQMDWLRYFTLARKNTRSIQAPRATRSSYDGAC